MVMMVDGVAKTRIKVGECFYNVEIVNDINHDDLCTIISTLYDCSYSDAKFEFLGSGSYGDVYGYKEYAIKKLFESEEFNHSRCNDIQPLKDLAHLSCIPKLYAIIDDDTIVVERIFGATVDQCCNEGKMLDKITIDESLVEKWDEALLEVISNGYSPDDLHESNVMIEIGTNRPVFVDLGWFYKHNGEYDVNDKNSLKSDKNYYRANQWAGRAIREFAERYASI